MNLPLAPREIQALRQVLETHLKLAERLQKEGGKLEEFDVQQLEIIRKVLEKMQPGYRKGQRANPPGASL